MTSYICLASHKVLIESQCSMHTSLPHLGSSNHLLMHPFLLEHSPSRKGCPICRSLSKAHQAAMLVILHPFILIAHAQEAAGKCCIDQMKKNLLLKRIGIPSIWGKKIEIVCSRCTAKVQREQQGPEPSGAKLSGQLCRAGYSQKSLLASWDVPWAHSWILMVCRTRLRNCLCPRLRTRGKCYNSIIYLLRAWSSKQFSQDRHTVPGS